MCKRDTYCTPAMPCPGAARIKCTKPICRKLAHMVDGPRVACDTENQCCHKSSLCNPTNNASGACRPCCLPLKAPDPCPPYGPVCLADSCGPSVEVDKSDRWNKGWN
ncbi:unnamed protein product [Mesocestoides corti]|uniref:Disintegrin domain-containing protein n=1 Tax=Mesocestoides corti TaxID=53468 RepID=A0A0R3ULY6_MESCO|nr:unnamed protein product [Mesocestoides corti]